jgi:hypothetical protein
MWIDLIWGFQQQGPAAEASNNVSCRNVFTLTHPAHPAPAPCGTCRQHVDVYPVVCGCVQVFYHLTYESALNSPGMQDPLTRRSAEVQIASFGQVPSQLFTAPHIRFVPATGQRTVKTNDPCHHGCGGYGGGVGGGGSPLLQMMFGQWLTVAGKRCVFSPVAATTLSPNAPPPHLLPSYFVCHDLPTRGHSLLSAAGVCRLRMPCSRSGPWPWPALSSPCAPRVCVDACTAPRTPCPWRL